MFYGRVSPFTRRRENLERDLSLGLASALPRFQSVVFDSGASVVRMVGVGLALGLQRIVLTGVDLNGLEYFWENNPNYKFSARRPRPVNNQTGYWSGRATSLAHETTFPGRRPFSVQVMIASLAQALAKDFGVEMFVASQKSSLSSFLPVYDWDGSQDSEAERHH